MECLEEEMNGAIEIENSVKMHEVKWEIRNVK